MTKFLIAAAVVAATFTPAVAMAQADMGPKAGATRESAVAAAAKAFSRMDQNGDGIFDSAEATAVLTARATKSGKAFRPKQATRMVSRNDGNSDGRVTLEEFQTVAGTRFDQTDANKNGTIDADEAKPARTRGA